MHNLRVKLLISSHKLRIALFIFTLFTTVKAGKQYFSDIYSSHQIIEVERAIINIKQKQALEKFRKH